MKCEWICQKDWGLWFIKIQLSIRGNGFHEHRPRVVYNRLWIANTRPGPRGWRHTGCGESVKMISCNVRVWLVCFERTIRGWNSWFEIPFSSKKFVRPRHGWKTKQHTHKTRLCELVKVRNYTLILGNLQLCKASLGSRIKMPHIKSWQRYPTVWGHDAMAGHSTNCTF